MQPKMDMLGLLQQSLSSIKGNGTGISDDVPAVMVDAQGKPVAKARLSEGEYVIKADVVSKLGGGATDPGVRFFDEFMKYVDKMDREAAVKFSEMVKMSAETVLDEQVQISDT